MRRPSVRLLALIAVLPTLFLLSPPRASYACTAEYPDEYFESHTIDVPPLPDGVRLYTTEGQIRGAISNSKIDSFTAEYTFQTTIDLRKDKEDLWRSLMAVTNLTDKPLYVLGEKNSEWVTPATEFDIIVPAGLVPQFQVEPGEGLAFDGAVLIGFKSPYDRPGNEQYSDFENKAHVNLYYDRQIIDVVITYTFIYNVDYAATAAAIDKAMDACQSAMMGGQPPSILSGFFRNGRIAEIAGLLILVLIALPAVGIAVFVWRYTRNKW